MIHGIWRIGMDEGVAALFRGTFARMMFHIPMNAISMSVIEHFKPQIIRWLDDSKN